MKYKISDYICAFLEAQSVSHVFEVAGGMIAQILDSLHRSQSINIISMHHEQSAAFAVDAIGKVSDIPCVAMATSGPGATNLLTGIGSCYFDSSPAIFITGQVNIHEQKKKLKVRQLGFQETDIVAMAKPITKKCYSITSANEVESVLREAFLLAVSGRPGPVLIDIPMDIQRTVIDIDPPVVLTQNASTRSSVNTKNEEQINKLIKVLGKSKRPLILAGGGVRSQAAIERLRSFIKEINIPVVTSLMGLGSCEYNNPLLVGFIGSYGNRWANIALDSCDLLIVLGSRLDIRQTGADTKSFSSGKEIFHIDIDKFEINNRITGCHAIEMDIVDFLSYSIGLLKNLEFPNWSEWLAEIKQSRLNNLDVDELVKFKGINPNVFFHQLSKSSSSCLGYCVDVGSHQMWAAQSIELIGNQFFITSGGMGAMGFSLPAAIGLSLKFHKAPVVVIVGDGSLQMNIQELQTIIRNKLPIKIVVLNNKSLGMITQFQDSYFNGTYQSTYWGYTAPDFKKIAQAYGIEALKIDDSTLIVDSLHALWNHNAQPFLLEVSIEPLLPTYPKIAFGRPISQMEPRVNPIAMEST